MVEDETLDVLYHPNGPCPLESKVLSMALLLSGRGSDSLLSDSYSMLVWMRGSPQLSRQLLAVPTGFAVRRISITITAVANFLSRPLPPIATDRLRVTIECSSIQVDTPLRVLSDSYCREDSRQLKLAEVCSSVDAQMRELSTVTVESPLSSGNGPLDSVPGELLLT
ncbi:hypothetical protein Hamer_G026556 [Homarus americanus]|uniref:Uncharacterized protein n=1 Tax=Homarus americanus TaxID=6706 RepID=A0A8J5NGI7_HOMAM|nr:hypothetical protein Hamer_G026556 [Homarus americanus]